MNYIPILAAAFVPTIVGFLWYNPKVFGNAWMQAADMTEEKMKGANMAVIFGAGLFLSVLLAFILTTVVIHQAHVDALFKGDDNPLHLAAKETFLSAYGDRFRTFGHGALHGLVAGLFIVLPVLGTNALFERKGYMYIAINVGYWCLTLALMGGIICQWA